MAAHHKVSTGPWNEYQNCIYLAHICVRNSDILILTQISNKFYIINVTIYKRIIFKV